MSGVQVPSPRPADHLLTHLRSADGFVFHYTINMIALDCSFQGKGAVIVKILVIDAQGGGIGRQVVAAIKAARPDDVITAVGSNSLATSAMLKAGADQAATGENAIVVGCRTADVIVGPVGIVIADSLLGEITPAMAVAIGQSKAKRVLIPINHCDNMIVGVADLSVSRLIQNVVETIQDLAATCL